MFIYCKTWRVSFRNVICVGVGERRGKRKVIGLGEQKAVPYSYAAYVPCQKCYPVMFMAPQWSFRSLKLKDIAALKLPK